MVSSYRSPCRIWSLRPVRSCRPSVLCYPCRQAPMPSCKHGTHFFKYSSLGSVTTYEHCICISDGFTNPLVFPAPEPPTIRIFLFLSYFGCSGLVILSHSVAVSGMLFHLTGSVYGSKSLSVPTSQSHIPLLDGTAWHSSFWSS